MDLTVLDPDIGGLGGPAFDNQNVVAGKFQFHRKMTAAQRHAHRAGQRRFGGDRHAAGARDGSPRERTTGKNQFIFRPQRIDPRFKLVKEILNAEAGPADIIAGHFGRQLLFDCGLLAQINP